MFLGNYIILNLFLAILLDGFTSITHDKSDDKYKFNINLKEIIDQKF